MSLGTLGAHLLWSFLIAKGVKKSKIPGQGVMREGENAIRAGQEFQCCLINSFWNAKVLTKMNLNLMVFIQEIIYVK